MSFSPGQLLGPYEIIEQAGKGGMGEVYQAKDTRLDRIVAIKVLPAALANNRELRDRFDREAKTISSLNHPNICTLYDVGHQDGIDFLVMEYIEGETLAERLSKDKLSLKEVLTLGIQIADALEAAHRRGLVHRDLKPGNIMLTKLGAKLVDFGLARLVQDNESVHGGDDATRTSPLTGEGSIVGTLQYMAPEQLEGKEVDHRADMFSFGAILYEMATGQRAFEGSSQASLIASILKENPRPIDELVPLSPPGLERIILQCLSKDPDERWQSAGDLKREIKWIGEQTQASTGQLDASMPMRSKRPAAWLIGTIVVLVAGLLGVSALYFSNRSKPPSISKRFVLPVESLKAGFGRVPVISPNGRFVVYKADNRMWVRDLTKFDAEAVGDMQSATPSETDDAEGFFWSPDSRSVAFGQNRRMWKYDIASGAKTPLCTVPETGEITAGAWSRNGYLFIAVYRGGLYRVSERGGEPELLIAIDSLKYHDFHTPTFLPDGQTLVLFVHAYKHEEDCLAILKEGSSELTTLLPATQAAAVTYSPTGHLLYTFAGMNPSIWAVPFSAEDLAITGKPFLAVPGGWYPSLSEDGAMVYSAGTVAPELQMMRMSLDGSSLTPIGKPIKRWSLPVFTPDGERISFTISDDKRGNLWQYDLLRGTQTRLTSDLSQDCMAFWMPSRREYIINRIFGVATGLILTLDPSTGKTTDTLAEGLFPSLSPDGRYLTYHTDVRGKIATWRLDLNDPTHPVVLIEPDENMGGGEAPIAPNGRWFAYGTDESGIGQVMIKPFLEPGEPIQVSIDGGAFPMWHPSGNALFYVADSALMQVDIVWGKTPKLSQPRMLVNASDQDLVFRYHCAISPDGTYFVVAKEMGGDSGQRLLYVDHWFPEVSTDR